MTDEAMSPLRRRMIEDVTIRKFAPHRIPHSSGARRTLQALMTCADTSCISLPGASAYRPSIRPSRHCGSFSGSRSSATIVEHTTFVHEPRKLPVVLSPEEVARLLDAAPGLKYKAALSVAYGAGLRAAEVISQLVAPSSWGRHPKTFR
jgi:integrase/recombinase XerD